MNLGDLIRKFLESLFGRRTTPAPAPGTVSPLALNFVAHPGSVRAVRPLNLRRDRPSTAAPIVRAVEAGQTLAFTGWVTNGESVENNSKWFKTQEGQYVWAGNVVEVVSGSPAPAGTYPPVTLAALGMVISPNKANECVGSLNQAMQEFGINTPLRQAAFIAQTVHESIGYTALKENLNYSAQALTATWPNRFPAEVAAAYARQPERIANRAYANRLGNGDEASGDGWRYRGRGIIQVTGKDNYRACGAGLGLDLVLHPELLEDLTNAFRSGGWFWQSRSLNMFADKEDFLEITRRVNGGTLGQAERERYYAVAKTALGIT